MEGRRGATFPGFVLNRLVATYISDGRRLPVEEPACSTSTLARTYSRTACQLPPPPKPAMSLVIHYTRLRRSSPRRDSTRSDTNALSRITQHSFRTLIFTGN
jgi:hypothetical protein